MWCPRPYSCLQPKATLEDNKASPIHLCNEHSVSERFSSNTSESTSSALTMFDTVGVKDDSRCKEPSQKDHSHKESPDKAEDYNL